MRTTNKALGVAALCFGSAVAIAVPAQAWEPTHPIEIIVPAGTGGGADQMARVTQGIITKHNLSKQSVVVINQSGGAGGEGFLAAKIAKGDGHKLIITLSNLFTTPLATGIPFNWKDLTPVAMLALDQFVLWVSTETPYKSAKEYLGAVKKAGPNKFKMGGTGSKQEDQIITVAIEKATGAKFTYVPFKGGGEAVAAIVGGHVTAGVSGVGEFAEQVKGGRMRALGVSAPSRMNGIPTLKEQGIDVELANWRGVFGAPGITTAQRDALVNLAKAATDSATWKTALEKFDWAPIFLGGDAFKKFVDEDSKRVASIIDSLGIKKKK